MFKRVICIVLLLCCFASAALAEVKYVDNGPKWDSRLNLRAEPTKSAQSLGRYYTGVRVQVMEDLGEWSRVQIALGTAGERVEGYMMNAYLLAADWLGVCHLPYIAYAGKSAYVMGHCGDRLHICYEDGEMAFIPARDVMIAQPTQEERMVKERVCTASGGASLHGSDGEVVAMLYGGVFFDDALLPAGREVARVSLQDENDEVRGLLMPGAWTWVDNGANCEEEYAVYESDTGLIEVLGEMADGRTILRLTDNGIDAPRVVLTGGFHLTGLTPLQREGAYYKYTRPLRDEHTDDALISRVYAQLSAEQLQKLAGCTAQVDRLIDFQYGHRMLQVRFVNVYGQVIGMADLSDAGMIWQWGDNG